MKLSKESDESDNALNSQNAASWGCIFSSSLLFIIDIHAIKLSQQEYSGTGDSALSDHTLVSGRFFHNILSKKGLYSIIKVMWFCPVRKGEHKLSLDSMRFRNFKEEEWHTFWGMISAAAADVPDVITGITDLGSKCSAAIGTIDAGIELWKIVNAHKKLHDSVKRKIYQHVPEALGSSVNKISKAIFNYLNRLKKQDKNIAYYYQERKDKEFADALYAACVDTVSAYNVPEPELRFFLSEVAKIILDPANALLLTEDEEILKGLLNSVRNLNEGLEVVHNSQHALKGELQRFLRDYSDLAMEVYELSDEVGWIKRDVGQIRDDVDHLKTQVNDMQQPLSSQQTQSQPDNQEYLERFDEPLFLEKDDESNVTLASMYVSPHISGTSDKAADRIMAWYRKKSRTTCMLLFGSAGVGKSTLVSKIIADANRYSDDRDFPLLADQVLAVALRNHCDDIDIDKKSRDILKDLFPGYSKDELRNKLLVLDGLDEICVLRRDFNGFNFLNKLAQLDTGFHVLVTSREDREYFDDPDDIIGIQIERLKWEKEELEAWCRKYADAKEEKRTWCKQFISEYTDMLKKNANDGRKDIFCVPIILYICGNSGIQLSDHDSVGEIYDDAFRRILLRKHIQSQEGQVDLVEADAGSNIITWQYTKELAYQMFLLNTLDLAEVGDPEHPHTKGLKNARSRTKAFLKEKCGLEVNDDALKPKKELALCPFTRSNNADGITFAHKTVYEYFTAVKLYEDYFTQFDAKYFQNNKPQTEAAAKAVAESYIEAFRYKGIPAEIFAYLNSMQKPPFSGSFGMNTGGFDAEHFLQTYVFGMKTCILSRVAVKEPVSEYNYWFEPVSEQFNRAFQNFTWFLTGHGFTNADDIDACKHIRDLLSLTDTEVCLSGWNLSGSDLHDVDLSNAYLSGTNLSSANLTGTNLCNADLRYANLSSANLAEANLSNADLSGANLTDADLTNSLLNGASIEAADLNGANLSAADLRTISGIPQNFESSQTSSVFLHRTKLSKWNDLSILPTNDSLLFNGLCLVNHYMEIVTDLGTGNGDVLVLAEKEIYRANYKYKLVTEPFTSLRELEDYISHFVIDSCKEKVLKDLTEGDSPWYIEEVGELYVLLGGIADNYYSIIPDSGYVENETTDSFDYKCTIINFREEKRTIEMKCIKRNGTWYISEFKYPIHDEMNDHTPNEI